MMRMYKKGASSGGQMNELDVEESGVSRDSRRSKIIKPRGTKTNLLNLNADANSQLSDDVDEIKF